ncbi:hypothetical protein KAZ82_00030 [Candidatus Babeliales bacterium]|nr:hypothetical protein [Candidatus Babeliales bacterium]
MKLKTILLCSIQIFTSDNLQEKRNLELVKNFYNLYQQWKEHPHFEKQILEDNELYWTKDVRGFEKLFDYLGQYHAHNRYVYPSGLRICSIKLRDIESFSKHIPKILSIYSTLVEKEKEAIQQDMIEFFELEQKRFFESMSYLRALLETEEERNRFVLEHKMDHDIDFNWQKQCDLASIISLQDWDSDYRLEILRLPENEFKKIISEYHDSNDEL